jgi:hypothetical protein
MNTVARKSATGLLTLFSLAVVVLLLALVVWSVAAVFG